MALRVEGSEGSALLGGQGFEVLRPWDETGLLLELLSPHPKSFSNNSLPGNLASPPPPTSATRIARPLIIVVITFMIFSEVLYATIPGFQTHEGRPSTPAQESLTEAAVHEGMRGKGCLH